MAETLRLLRRFPPLASRCRQCGALSPWRGASLRPTVLRPGHHQAANVRQLATPTSPRARKRQPNLRSQKILEQEGQAAGGITIPDDLGLMPSTLVAPPRSQLPSWISEPGRRWRWEKTRFMTKLGDTAGLVVIKFLVVPQKDPTKPWYARLYDTLFKWYNLETFSLSAKARTLYEAMNTSFGQGDLDPVRQSLCEPLRLSLESRVRARGQKEMRWTLHTYLSRPRLMSYKVAVFDIKQPKHKRDAIQQAVVRLRSMQSLERPADPRAKEVVKAQPRELTEYVVIQKMVRRGVEEPWKVWGTTQPTPIDLETPTVAQNS